jgi:hypothetical protein
MFLFSVHLIDQMLETLFELEMKQIMIAQGISNF